MSKIQKKQKSNIDRLLLEQLLTTTTAFVYFNIMKLHRKLWFIYI